MVINYLAVVVAAVVAWIIGGAWYAALGKQWMAALGWTQADVRGGDGGKPPMAPMVISFVADLVMAFMMAGLIGHFGAVTIKTGAIVGLLTWLGFVVTTHATVYAFQKRSLKLFAIDVGHWFLAMLATGLVLGAFG